MPKVVSARDIPQIEMDGESPKSDTPSARDAQAMEHVRGLLKYIGEDPNREGLKDTPKRVIGAMMDHFRGYSEDPAEFLSRTFSEVGGYNELVLITDIELHSHCEHHMVPFVGRAHVGYIPDGKVVGLSKIARVVDAYAKRLQVQEKLTAQIADAINTHLNPQGVAVILQCQHFCMCYRGVKKPGSWTTTSKLHGCFLKNPSSRMELFTLLGMERGIG
ncbi:MAG TPA: GTP cyclohydrolase I FolE [Phycisphaerales bacterium]|nr:GTP cyclohydrolase I FolE [Phycisphaerales bacterium]